MQCKTSAHVSQRVVRTVETFARRYLLFALIVAVFIVRYRGCFADQEYLAVTRWPDLGLVSVRLLANPPPAVHGTPRKPPKSFILASLPLFVARCTYVRRIRTCS